MKILLLIALLAMPNSTFTYGYMHTNTTLYTDPGCINALTSLPATYFVIVLESEGGVHKVSYKDVTGYVTDIDIVDYEPVTKYASARFNVNNDGYPVKLRSGPTDTSNVVIEVPAGKSGYYYGDIQGTALIPQVGGKWHYVCYTDGLDSYYGYVYTSQVTVSEITPNIIEKVEHKDEGEELIPSPLSNTDFLLIACLCVPSVLIMYLIFRDKEKKPRYKE
ncbi:MAG: hypothetical protein J1F36_04845 [Clostridiales bacterium]|nr:hypothetical protein [Clostridiales bacterium]